MSLNICMKARAQIMRGICSRVVVSIRVSVTLLWMVVRGILVLGLRMHKLLKCDVGMLPAGSCRRSLVVSTAFHRLLLAEW